MNGITNHEILTDLFYQEAVFVLGYCAGIMTCVRLAWVRGMFSVNNLAGDSSILGRVWNSLTRSGGPTADQSGQKTTGHVITSLAVCRDHKFWIWSLTSYDCILATDLVQFTAEAGRQVMGGSQGHRVSLGMSSQ